MEKVLPPKINGKEWHVAYTVAPSYADSMHTEFPVEWNFYACTL